MYGWVIKSAIAVIFSLGAAAELRAEPLAEEIKHFDERRVEFGRRLVQAVKSPATFGDREAAINALGEMRIVEGVPILLDFLTERSQLSGRFERLGAYPAARAISLIGLPAVPEIVGRLGRATSDRELYILTFVFYAIDGKLAWGRVDSILQTDKLTATQRDNLEVIRRHLEKVDFKNPSEWPR